MWIADVRRTVSDAAASFGGAETSVAIRRGRQTEFCALWGKGEVDVADFLCAEESGKGECEG